VPEFHVTALGTAILPLHAQLTGDEGGTVTVTVTSLTNPSVTSTRTVEINGPGAQIRPPVAIAGPPQNAKTGSFVFLNGKDSFDPNGMPITFQWTVMSVPGGSSVSSLKSAGKSKGQAKAKGKKGTTTTAVTVAGAGLNSGTTPRPFFLCDLNGTYTLQLVVSNGILSSAPSQVQVICRTGNVHPNARAGADQNIGVGHAATLDGSESFDPDSGPQALSYQWSLVTAPAGSALTTADIANRTTMQAQVVADAAGDFIFNLRVSDGSAVNNDTVIVHAFTGNVPPNARSGADRFAEPQAVLELDGTASVDPDNGPSPLAHRWWLNAAPPGSAAALTDAATPHPQFSPDLTGYFIARLEASDGLALGFANTLITVAERCDADANGLLNQLDLDVIADTLGRAIPQGDPRDFDGNGMLDSSDLRGCESVIAPKTTVSVGTDPAGLSFSVDGTTFTSTQTFLFAPGTSIVVNVPSPQGTTGTRYTFLDWSDGGSQSHSVPVGSAAVTLTARFATSYQLAETLAGSGHGTVVPGSGGYYPAGSSLVLNAQPDACSTLAGFSANAPNGTVTFNSPQAVTITFDDASAFSVGTLSVNGQRTGPVEFKFGGDRRITGTNRWRRVYTLKNTGPDLTNVVLALDPPRSNVAGLVNGIGQTQCAAPLGSSYVAVPDLKRGASVQVAIEVTTQDPLKNWSSTLRLLAGGKP
jgi:hypothetical protein